MHLEQRTGNVPGLVFATVRQGMTTRTFPIEVRQTPSGHYISRMPDQRWSIECQTIESALLMHAAVIFPFEYEHAPWLSNPRPAPRPTQRYPHVTEKFGSTRSETRYTDKADRALTLEN
ncbi:hypothetical protein FXF46_09880 [Gluconobacter thailandicus]|uniref:Uncharacterized protein n=1 Tax=Gluconobacter thailandicus TaxID=257438 RepID=A0AAP9ETH5_GLUTH|nr:hypothetical protein [Gluconobacter thailandicus]KXV33259.1 hypothetical protein AD940_11450 [Gluconobacter thailandicus]QEH96570.1 hypothetical protein FXF46_09880 [Gluconobacter thailandicus]